MNVQVQDIDPMLQDNDKDEIVKDTRIKNLQFRFVKGLNEEENTVSI